MARPKRKNKSDRLLAPDASKTEIRCDMSIAPLDRLARTMDERWGVDQLVTLVSPETADKYGSAMAKLNASYRGNDPEACRHRAQVCMRGLTAMDAEAKEAGHTPGRPYWEYDLDGFKFAVMRENEDWAPVKKERPDLRLFSMREVAVALRHIADNPIILEVKDQFPMAELESIKQRSAKTYDDPIPFGDPK